MKTLGMASGKARFRFVAIEVPSGHPGARLQSEDRRSLYRVGAGQPVGDAIVFEIL